MTRRGRRTTVGSGTTRAFRGRRVNREFFELNEASKFSGQILGGPITVVAEKTFTFHSHYEFNLTARESAREMASTVSYRYFLFLSLFFSRSFLFNLLAGQPVRCCYAQGVSFRSIASSMNGLQRRESLRGCPEAETLLACEVVFVLGISDSFVRLKVASSGENIYYLLMVSWST